MGGLRSSRKFCQMFHIPRREQLNRGVSSILLFLNVSVRGEKKSEEGKNADVRH